MSRVRKIVAITAAAAILALVNYAVFTKERLLEHGRRVYLELAPVDPRSLMQGDYMALRFAIADAARSRLVPPGSIEGPATSNGRIVAGVDGRGVASFRRLADARPLAADEVYLRYRVREGEIKLATNAFFFEEGTGERYEPARYGEFRVAPDGDLLLTGLRGKDLEPLGNAGQTPISAK